MDEEIFTQNYLGVPLFTWTNWDEAGLNFSMMFYDVNFLLPSLQQLVREKTHCEKDFTIIANFEEGILSIFPKNDSNSEIVINILKNREFLLELSNVQKNLSEFKIVTNLP